MRPSKRQMAAKSRDGGAAEQSRAEENVVRKSGPRRGCAHKRRLETLARHMCLSNSERKASYATV